MRPRSNAPVRRSLAAPLLAVVVMITGCAASARGAAAEQRPEAPDIDAPADVDEDSLTASGRELADRLDGAPDYELTVDVDPGTGDVAGTMTVTLPAGVGDAGDHATFRWFPNLTTLGAAAELTATSVDGAPVDVEVDETIVTVPLDGAGDRPVVAMSFEYRIPETDLDAAPAMPGTDGLELGSIGLLGRTADAVAMGHWFPVWLPAGVSAEPEPDGYGDIGNFPAATFAASITTPTGATVVTGGARVDERAGDDDTTTVVETGAGLRDLSVVVLDEAEVVERDVGTGDDAVVVRVIATPEQRRDAAGVLDEVAVSVEALTAAFGTYPWRELDVLSVPLGSGVGGMEWPGMLWIEPTIFGGGVPGLGDLGDLGEMGDLFEVLLGDEMGLTLETTRAWTVAHETGHMWWHAIVGNDSVTDPVVDEPLAQHAACVAMRSMRPADADAVCEAQTFGQYRQIVGMLSVADAAADRPTPEFDSSLQYGAVVYGKAPGFYRALEDEFGVDAVTDALAGVVATHAFEQIDGDQLATTLGTELGEPERVAELWTHWMDETHGDADVGATAGLPTDGSLGGLDIDELLDVVAAGPDTACD